MNKSILYFILGAILVIIGFAVYYFSVKQKVNKVEQPSKTMELPSKILAAKLNLPPLDGVEIGIKDQYFPKKYTCDGENINFAIKLPKPGVYAVVMEDPDAPIGNWFHWGIIVWNTDYIPEGLPKEFGGNNFMQCHNDFYYYNFIRGNIKGIGYDGPCPPPGKPHRYYIEVFELDQKPAKLLKEKDEFMDFVKAHAKAMYVTYRLYGR